MALDTEENVGLVAPTEPFTSRMLISKQKGRYKRINGQRTATGTFYTHKTSWLTTPVQEFLEAHRTPTTPVLDPFAGNGDLLTCLSQRYPTLACEGYDIARGERWPINDSLAHIPNPSAALICTNPPYLAKHSAKRKGVFAHVQSYYATHYDLYELAITRSMETAQAAILIVPETFLHSAFPKTQLALVSVITESPFTDTDNPVCVACFETDRQDGNDNARVYVDNQYVCRLSTLRHARETTRRDSRVVFNDPAGNLALKAVDGTAPHDRVRFAQPDQFYYGRNRIKHSSRLVTYIRVHGIGAQAMPTFIDAVNQQVETLRRNTADLILSPFKGNNKAGQRRRRLDYALARTLIVQTLEEYVSPFLIR